SPSLQFRDNCHWTWREPDSKSSSTCSSHRSFPEDGESCPSGLLRRTSQKMHIILGNGAEFFAPPNFRRPRMKRTSAFPRTKSCIQRVSVLEGKRQTTTAPFNDSR